MHFKQIMHMLFLWKHMRSHTAAKFFIAIISERTQDVYLSKSHVTNVNNSYL